MDINTSRGAVIAAVLLGCTPEGRTVSELVPVVCHDTLAKEFPDGESSPRRLASRIQTLGLLVLRPIKSGVVAELLTHNEHLLQRGLLISRRARHGHRPHIYRAWSLSSRPIVGTEESQSDDDQGPRTVVWEPPRFT